MAPSPGTVRRILSAALVAGVLLAPAGAAPAAAGPSDQAQRLQAAGAGADFEAVVGARNFQARRCFADPSGDVVNLDDDGVSVTEPRADLIEHCATLTRGLLTLSAGVAEPTDPETDDNWAGSLLGWFVDVDGDDVGEFFASMQLDGNGMLVGTVQDRAVDPAARACSADASYASGVLTLVVESGCIDDADSVAVSPGLIYDQRVTNFNGSAVFDKAPNAADFEPEIRVGADVFAPGVNRIAGQTRILTAIEGSQATFADDQAGAVVLTRSDLFPDAQAGTPLAIAEDAPLLLTPPAGLDGDTADELRRVLRDGGTVYLLGGTAALSTQVESSVAALGFTPVRLGGDNRFSTATTILAALGDPSVLLAADGGDFADSVLAGAASGAAAAPGEPVAGIILTAGGTVPPATASYLAATDAVLVAVGGDAAQAFPDAPALVGATRFETAVEVAEAFFDNPDLVGIATGLDFADALTGGAIIGRVDGPGPGPMLLTDPADLPDSVRDYLTANAGSIDTAVVFGGTNAISESVAAEVAAAIGP